MIVNKSGIPSVVIAAVCFLFLDTSIEAQTFSISWYKIAGGGGYNNGGNFELEGTIGQHDAGPVMTGGGFQLAGGFWAGGTTSETVLANSFNVLLGTLNSGSVSELQNSDNQYAVLSPIFESARYQLIFTVDGISSTETPFGLAFSLESKTFNFIGTVDQRIELFNYTTGQYEVVDTQSASPTDSVTLVTPIGDLARFVESDTGAMQARIHYQNALPFWVFSIENAYLPFRTSVDHVFWTITP